LSNRKSCNAGLRTWSTIPHRARNKWATGPARHLYEQPNSTTSEKIRFEVRDFFLDKAIPQFATAIEAQIDCDNASDDFIKEKRRSSIRSSSIDSITGPYGTAASKCRLLEMTLPRIA
jgi:hypothetical protein